MSLGIFLGGFGAGFSQGVKNGKTLHELIQEGKIQDLRTKGMEEAEATRARTAAAMIKEAGNDAEEQRAKSSSALIKEVGLPDQAPSEPAAPAPTPASPTANPDAAGAATAAGTYTAPPNVSTQAPAAAPEKTASTGKGVLFIAGAPGQNPKGLVEVGNIDLNARPVVKNPDGTISTERSFSIGVDGKEVLIPQVIDGKVVSQDEAIAHFKKTGQHLGTFDSPEAATAYAESLHNRQDASYNATPAQPTPQTTVQSTGLTGANAPKFTVNGKGYATREEAQKAADAATPTANDFFMKNAVPKIAAGYLAQGDPAKAKAWQHFAKSHNGERAMKDWAAAYTAPDFDTAASKFGKYYTDHINDGVDYTGHKMLTKSDGTQVAVVTLKDKASGKETEMELTRDSMLALGAANNPQKLFELEQAKQTAVEKLRYEAKLKATQRKEDNSDKKDLEGYKQDRIDAREADKSGNKKTTDPTERRALIRSDEMKNNPKFARMSKEEQNKVIDDAMETVYGDKAKADKPAAAPAATAKPIPPVKDVKIVYHKQTGEPYQLIDGQYVRVEVPAAAKPEAKPALAPAPAPAAPAAPTPAKAASSGMPEPKPKSREPSDYVKNLRKSEEEKKASRAKDEAEAARAAAELEARSAAARKKIGDDFNQRYGR